MIDLETIIILIIGRDGRFKESSEDRLETQMRFILE